jgi:hypothetical protein
MYLLAVKPLVSTAFPTQIPADSNKSAEPASNSFVVEETRT